MTLLLISFQLLISVVFGAGTLESIQPFIKTQSGSGVELVNLNSSINSWYLLRSKQRVFNLRNARAPQIELKINAVDANILEFYQNGRLVDSCVGWIDLVQKAQTAPFAPVCGHRLFVRNGGSDRAIERGEQLFRAQLSVEGIVPPPKSASNVNSRGPRQALLRADNLPISPGELDIELPKEISSKSLIAGLWYPIGLYPGVFISLTSVNMVSRAILESYPKRVQPLQDRETNRLVYLVAFDMHKYGIGWAHETSLPGIDASFGDLRLAAQVPPDDWSRTVATISGGFQKRHSHFRRGYLASVNGGSPYGFIEDGVILQKPSPGLSTIVAYKDGSFTMKTWTAESVTELPNIRYLRQNGAPLIEPDSSGMGIPGALVGNRPEGNWSGNAEGDNFSPRGAGCMIEQNQEQYFVYAYFTSATPNAEARVLQAYGCKQGIQLDMNSAEKAYMTLIDNNSGNVKTQHLIKEMAEGDPGRKTARFLFVPDFRDFLWIMKR